jgi:ribonuclease P protein component
LITSRYGAALKRFSFPKSKRLVSGWQFEAVLARNLRVSNGLFTLYIGKNECGYPRLGVSIGKSCGDAVVRNRLKRLLREVFRQYQDQIPADLDYLLMVSPHWAKKLSKSADIREAVRLLTFERVKTSFLALVNRARRLDSQKVKQ